MSEDREYLQMKAEKLKPDMIGRIYRHFKGNYYKVLNLAVHSEGEGIMVIYSDFHGDGTNTHAYITQREWFKEKVWARPLDMFLSEVDHEKYPDVKQKLRFEPIKGGSEEWWAVFSGKLFSGAEEDK